MMKTEQISVIVPVYQVKAYLSECLESILSQTYPYLEIILVDDGSTDGSGELCDEYAKKDSRIRVIHKENGGLVSARKTAMKIASGKWIAYVDSDDWIDRDMYERMFRAAVENTADIVVAGHLKEFPDKTITWKNAIPAGSYEGQALKEEIFPRMLYNPETYHWALSPACWDKLMRKDLVLRYQMTVDERIWDGEDHAFIYAAILAARRICILDETPYHYRIREDSVSMAYDPRGIERLGYLYADLLNCYQKSGYWDILEKPFAYQMRWFLLKHMKSDLGVDVYENGEAVRPYLFPFGAVPCGCRIILYGAGNVGELFYRQVFSTEYCKIAAWVSQDYQCHGDRIQNPQVIRELEYDFVVIAVADADVAEEIRETLIRMKIPGEKIIWKDPLIKRNR